MTTVSAPFQRRRLCALGAIALAAAGSLGGTAWAQQPRPPASALAYHTVAAATQAGWHSHEAQVEAVRDALLSAQVPGAIVAVQVQAGDAVKKGQPLLKIDGRMAQQGAVASQAQVSAAQAQLHVARKEYERQQQLFAKHYISQAALDSAQAQWQAAQAQVKALQAQAGVAATQSGLHTITAPFDGIVARVPVTVGDMALPGTPLIALYDPSALRITAQLANAPAQALRQADEVQIELPSAAQRLRLAATQVQVLPSAAQRLRLAATQVQVLPSADPLTHTVTVRVTLPADATKLVPGLFARLWVPATAPSASADGAAARLPVWIPAQAVVRRAEMTGVYVQAANGQPQLRQVRLGPVQGDQIEVLSGLRPGDQVALEPQKAAKGR